MKTDLFSKKNPGIKKNPCKNIWRNFVFLRLFWPSGLDHWQILISESRDFNPRNRDFLWISGNWSRNFSIFLNFLIFNSGNRDFFDGWDISTKANSDYKWLTLCRFQTLTAGTRWVHLMTWSLLCITLHTHSKLRTQVMQGLPLLRIWMVIRYNGQESAVCLLKIAFRNSSIWLQKN